MIADFHGHVAVITGAGSGIGRATALAFAREGASIVVSDINPLRAESVAEEVRQLGAGAVAVRCDVAEQGAIESLRQAALAEFGKISILMNNAGVVYSGQFLELPLSDWRKSYEINLFSVIEATQRILPDILAAGGGHVINVASVTALYPFNVDRMSYNSARAAVVNFSEALALDLWDKGVGVTCLCPGPTRTNMIENVHFVGKPNLTPPDLPMMEPAELADKLVLALREGRYFVPGHELVREHVARRGADPDAFLASAAEQFRTRSVQGVEMDLASILAKPAG
jgi:NAD(P)-dependent dehydrogenase (short-subunit alcohol dehydrogenase family)